MAQIIVAEVFITEQSVRELMKAIEEAKEKNFVTIDVESVLSDIRFVINIESEPHTQESVRYYLKKGYHGPKGEH